MDDEEFKRVTKALVKSRRPDIDDEDLDLHHDSSFYWEPENFSQAADWKTITILQGGANVANRNLFINFFGILNDNELISFLKDKTSLTFDLLGVKEADNPRFIASNKDRETREFFGSIWEAKNVLEVIRKDVTEDELFLLRFVRHRYCRVTLSRFAVRIEGRDDDAKYKTANWKRLVALSKTMTVSMLRENLVKKLAGQQTNLSRLRTLIAPAPGGRLFAE